MTKQHAVSLVPSKEMKYVYIYCNHGNSSKVLQNTVSYEQHPADCPGNV